MLLNAEDKALIKNLQQFKECGGRRILVKFLENDWRGKDWTLY